MRKFIVNSLCFLFAFSFLLFGTQNTFLAKADSGLDITSKSAILVEADSGDVLFSKDETKRLPVASMVKMMTILLSLEQFDQGNVSLDTKITASENASGMGGSQVFLDAYADYTFEDLLKSVIMASANDASVALAEYFAGNEKNFTSKMNERAKALGMNDTHYANCTGLPAPEQYSSALDTSIVLKEILKHEIYHKYSTIWMDKLVHPSGRETELVNTNRLVRYFEGCDGGKTGSTNEAGCCLGASAKRDGMRLISVIVGAENSKTRFNESSALLSFGFANFKSTKLVDDEVALANLNVLKGKKQSVEAFAKESFSAVTKKGEKSGYETKIDIFAKIKAPTKAGDEVGTVTVTKDGVIVKTIPIVIKENIKPLSLIETSKKILNKW